MPDDKQSRYPFAILRKFKFSRSVAAKAAILLGVGLLIAVLFPVGTSIELDYKVGGVWAQRDLIAPFSFPVHRDDREYTRDVEEAKRGVFPVFERDTRAEAKQLETLRRFFHRLKEIIDLRRKLEGVSKSSGDSLLVARVSELEIPFSTRDWLLLDGFSAQERLQSMKDRLIGIGLRCWDLGVLDRPKSSLSNTEIAVRTGTEETIVRPSVLYDSDEMGRVIETDLRETHGNQDNVVGLFYRIAVTHLGPNLLYNRTATETALNAAIESVRQTIGFVQENERIVSKHERITDETRLKLESFRRAKVDRGGEEHLPIQFLGIFLHVLVVVMLYGIYLGLFRKKIFSNNGQLLLIGLLICIQGVFAYATREVDVDVPVEYLIVVPVTSMLLTILFDSRVAFYGTVILAFLVGGIRGNDYSIALASLVAGALSVYTVRDIRNRTQIFHSMGFIFLGYAVSILALALERFDSPASVLNQLLFAGINALASPVLAYGLLIFFERVFRLTTDLTLIELSHFNHPLLRQLAEKAPGTYHHSMTIASLAETAATAIGANDILARVGAYFHDIGKIVKPAYFVENQRGSRSRHDKLAPRMSSLIIQAHVKEGIGLARQHKLPEEIVDCIPMHHGTTRIEFFYNKALRLAESSVDESKLDEIKEQDYRYPGPKPQTKETGILMLADAVEARARALEDPSPQNLEATIDEVVTGRFREGELNECPLTLKDLTNIKEAFLRVLVGVYHMRVQYPEVKSSRQTKQAPVPSSNDEKEGTVLHEGDDRADEPAA